MNVIAQKKVLIDCLQSPLMSWKNIIHLNATKMVEISSHNIAAPNTSGMLNGIKLQNMVWKPRRWWTIDNLSKLVAFPSGLNL